MKVWVKRPLCALLLLSYVLLHVKPSYESSEEEREDGEALLVTWCPRVYALSRRQWRRRKRRRNRLMAASGTRDTIATARCGLRFVVSLVFIQLVKAGDVELNPGPKDKRAPLSRQDHQWLCEAVSEAAAKWRALGRELGFTHDELGDVTRCPGLNEDKDYMDELLSRWLKWAPPNHPLPCVEDLATALYSKSVGEERTAYDLMQMIKSADTYKKHGGRWSIEETSSQIPQTSSDAAAVLGRSIDYLRKVYTFLSPTSHDSDKVWYPRCEYIKLALVEGKALKTQHEEKHFDIALTGQIELAMRKGKKVPIQLKDIFSKCKDTRRLVVIEGPPGIGKSTLIIHICHNWEKRNLFSQFKWVIRVPLREEAIQNASCLADIIPARSREEAEAFAKVILESLGSEGLLLFDGWDEHSHRTTFLADLVENPLEFGLDLCTIVVTTRPVAADKLRRLATSRIDIMGFGVEERLEYFKATLEDYEEELEELLEHLDKHPLIAGSAYIPVVAAFLVDIVLAPGMSLPITLHCMFVDIILCNILRETTKSSPELDICIRNINTLDGLIDKYPSISSLFLSLCRLAYYGAQENRVVFYINDLEKAGLSDVESTKLGLVQAVKHSTSCSKGGSSYSFIHLTVQETLAAYYTSRMSEEEQVKTFQNMLGNPRLANVLQMYAGFSKLRSESVREVIGPMVKESKPVLVSVLNSLYEAQDASLCLYVSHLLNGQLDLEDTSLSHGDCISIGYFLSCVLTASSTEDYKVILQDCSLDDLHIDLMMKEVDTSKHFCLSYLDLYGNMLGDKGLQRVLKFARCCQLNALYLSVEKVSMPLVYNLTEYLKAEGRGLQELALHGDFSGKEGLAIIMAEVNKLKLVYLGLLGNHLEEGWMEMLQGVSDLKGLTLAGNEINISSLIPVLKRSPQLEILGLGVCSIDDGAVTILSQTLVEYPQLKKLYLFKNNISEEGLALLLPALQQLKHLKHLDLEGNPVPEHYQTIAKQKLPNVHIVF